MTAHRWRILGGVSLFLLAFGARLGLVLTSPGGLRGNLGDDAAAYYAGADALAHGRLPYRDFTLLHPPLLILVLVPFAVLGMLLGDHVGFELATLATEASGAACAALVALLCRRYGFARPAAWLAGLFYAVWFGAALTDMLIRLETLANLLTLLGLLALTRSGRRAAVTAGVALGLASATKAWGVVAVLVVVLWLARTPSTRRRAGQVAAGAAAALAVVIGPFLLAAPSAAWRMIVADQLHRPADYAYRLPRMTTVYVVDPARGSAGQTVWTVAVCAVVLVLLALAMRVAGARLAVALLVVELAVLARSPSYFEHYLGLIAVPLAVIVGAGAQAGLAAPIGRWRRGAVPVLVAAAIGVAAFVTAFAMGRPAGSGPKTFPVAAVARAIRGSRCPVSDGPVALILTDRLSGSLADGCPQWVDVTGHFYDVEGAATVPDHLRPRYGPWQRDLTRYLLSGDTVITFRPGAAPGPMLQRRLDRLPLLVRQDGITVRRIH